MALALYMDHQVPKAITNGLRLRGVDVLTAYEDGTHRISDAALLDRATELRRVLFTQDDDLVEEAAKRQQQGRQFWGVIYGHQLRLSIGDCVRDLEIIAETGASNDVVNQVLFLPL
jgi:hypothetical protein